MAVQRGRANILWAEGQGLKLTMREHVFTGFGFGPIQSGLFASEAFVSGNFKEIIIAEIDQKLVDAVRANGGTYFVNVAKSDSIEAVKVDNVQLYNPNLDADRKVLLAALQRSTEIVTSLPSVSFFNVGENSVASLIAEGVGESSAAAMIIYTAENNNHAAEILSEAVAQRMGRPASGNVQFLNTVIGKMSRVVTDPAEIKEMNLATIAPGFNRAFLVEAFNKILVTRCTIAGFEPGIKVFIEKDDLLPFEEAKLYGHNAIHALLAYLGMAKGYKKMTEMKGDKAVMKIARNAFLDESGAALIKKYAGLGDELFTKAGYKIYAEDLLDRMTNPFLEDTTARAGRDIVRKLAVNDRIFGTMSLAIEYGIEPVNMAMGAAAGIRELLANPEENKLPDTLRFGNRQNVSARHIEELLLWLWQNKTGKHGRKIVALTCEAVSKLAEQLKK
jgi:mannitol-1-phosphate 5-dehydrogenase